MKSIKQEKLLKSDDSLADSVDSLADSVRVLSDITSRDIEKSYNIDQKNGTEAYYSDRYGWTLRKTIV